MLDIITVVFKDELDSLQTQARSVAKYCEKSSIGNIYVVVNDTQDVTALIDCDWWGNLSSKVIVLDRCIFSDHWCSNGWVSQQALKLITAATSHNQHSMILDAKTIFVRELLMSQLFDCAGQIQTGQLDVYPVFDTSRNIVNKLFGIELVQQAGPGGVPFVVHNHTVRAMIAEVCAHTDQSFAVWFQAQGMLTEFLLYSGYVVKSTGSLDTLYSRHNRLGGIVNVCHSEVDSWSDKFAQMQQPSTLTVSVHRHAWSKLLTSQQLQYRMFLKDQGVFEI